MKKRFSALMGFITFLVFSFIFSGCLNDISESSDERRYVRANVISSDGSAIFDTTSSSRTIISTEKLSGLTCWMEGSSSSGTTISLTKITINPVSSTKGTFDYDFEPCYYKLDIYAVRSADAVDVSDVRKLAVMKASVAADLSANDEIYFYLSPNKVSGNGYFELQVYADGWDIDTALKDYTVTAGLYSKSNGVLIAGTGALGEFKSFNSTPAVFEKNFSSEVGGVESGTYTFKVTFHNNVSGAEFYYTDDIVIYANQTVQAVVAIPDVVGRIPSAPTYLIAGYEDNTSTSSDYYPVEFCWDDTAYNENYYELDILDITSVANGNGYDTYIAKLLGAFENGSLKAGVTTAKMDEWWNALKTEQIMDSSCYKTFSSSYFENSSFTPDGSFSDNSVYAVLKLVYGKVYLARIRAVNSAGGSENVYLDITNSGNRSFLPTNSGMTANLFQNATGISRYKIIYYLNGGLYYDNDEFAQSTYVNVSSLALQIHPVIEYRTHSHSVYADIANPLNVVYSTGKTASLRYKKDNSYHIWTGWKNGGIAKSAYTDSTGSTTQYSGYENLYLYATYQDVAEAVGQSFVLRTSTLPAQDADIVITAHKSTVTDRTPFLQDTESRGEPLYFTGTEPSVSISKSDFKYLNFCFNLQRNPDVSGVTFRTAAIGKQLKNIEVTGTANWGGTAFAYAQIDISSLSTGIEYYVYYTMESNGSYYKYAVSFTVTD